MAIIKGFIKNQLDTLLPITRAELVLDKGGSIAFHSPDFVVNEQNGYGLISYTDLKAIQDTLSGTENAGILTVLQNQLTSINKGLKIGDQSLNFYKGNEAIETTITSSNPNVLQITLKNQEEGKQDLEFNIRTIHNKDLTLKEENKIIKSIEVDTYGRVTDATQDVIYDSELPQTLSGKTLNNCTTTAVGDSENALVNKRYVDDRFDRANQVATGALIFGGTISNQANANDKLTVSDNKYKYYKVTATKSFTLNSDQTSEGNNPTVKLGDTLIITDQQKYIHIPSGDDVAMISVGGGDETSVSSPIIQSLSFSPQFHVLCDGANASISIPTVTSGTSNVSFKPSTELYKLGTLTIDNNPYTLEIPPYSEYSLELESNQLKFKKDKTTSNTITFGGQGISVTGKDNSININPNVDGTYISILDGIISAVIADPENNKTNGLVNYDLLETLATNIYTQFSQFEKIENPLTDKTKKYYYGSDDLKAAINID